MGAFYCHKYTENYSVMDALWCNFTVKGPFRGEKKDLYDITSSEVL